MINKNFEEYKVRREINRSGVSCKFYRPQENTYGELDQNNSVSLSIVQEGQKIDTFFGLYHEVNSHVKLETGTTTQYRTLKVPAFLIPYKDIQGLELRTNDLAEINGKKFVITKVGNIQEWNLIADIYLEAIDNEL